jgi:NCS1 family nucleobase:cation symporter-1
MMNRATFGLWGTSLPITVVGLGGIVYVCLPFLFCQGY